ncbi:MAG TPA: hypothetical protein VKT75_05710 [Acidobacteriaceae bacterium]|nr:hypothetical protein [Acidobacteriaceae bacterium]
MRFLSGIWLPPICLFLLTATIAGTTRREEPWGAIAIVSLFWLWIDLPLTLAYVLYRIFFRAKRDAQRWNG